jgi:hypothetical protein
MNRSLAISIFALFLSPAFAQNNTEAIPTPRFSYEIRAGYFEPKLERYELFYGDDRETIYAISGGYRFKDWLEVGAELGRMRSRGVGLLTVSQQLGGAVEYKLIPLQIYSNFILQRESRQRAVPYLGFGLSAARYEQHVELQSQTEGTTDLGYSVRLGLRFFLGSNASDRPAFGSRDALWNSYMFIEASELSTKIRDVDLGGQSFLLGFRMEFDL